MAKQLSEQQQKFIDVLFDQAGGNLRKAMRIAGYSDGYSPTTLAKVLRDEIIEATQLYLALNAPKAAAAIVGAIDDPTELGLKEKMSAAKDLMDRAGLVKTEKVQVESNIGGVMLLPVKEKEEH